MYEVKLVFKELSAVSTYSPGRLSSPDGMIFFEVGAEYQLNLLDGDVLDVSHLTIDPLVVKARDIEDLARNDKVRVSLV